MARHGEASAEPPLPLPLPPPELAFRVGCTGDDPLAQYELIGTAVRDVFLSLLPDGWTFEGTRVLDFGCGAGRILRHFAHEAHTAEFWGCDIDAPSVAWMERELVPPFHVFRNDELPPLPLDSDSFDLVLAASVFTHLAETWSAWLVELHRILRRDGLLVATFCGAGMSELLAGEEWDESRIGMNVLMRHNTWEHGGPLVLHSPWWIREHWGRAFDVLELWEAGFGNADRREAQGVAVLRKRAVRIDEQELERISRDEPREVAALQHQVLQLQRESAWFAERYFERVGESSAAGD